MKLALAQINTTVGDLSDNVARCLDAISAAGIQGADLIVLPEMAVPGYPPRDILFDNSFVQAVAAATQDLAQRAVDLPPAIVGTLTPADHQLPNHPNLYNTAVLLQAGEAHPVAYKRLLPTYDVFYEARWFLPGPAFPPIKIAGRSVGVLICEDMWDEDYPVHPGTELVNTGADLLVCIAATPYRKGVQTERLYHARRQGCPIAHLNLVGANDELIFDGRSFVLDAEGQLTHQSAAFKESVEIVDLDAPPTELPCIAPEAEHYHALTLGIGDFAAKNNLKHAFLGLSGGVDSAVTVALAAAALGPENVTGIAIPARYTDPRSTESARQLATTLGIAFEVVELENMHTATEATLGDLLTESGTAAENVQARLRMLILMSYVNRSGGLLLNTSNKTELALGYSTIYGDMAGTLSPLGDLTKPEVYALANWIDANQAAIPAFCLERPPSAELRPDQVDPFDYPKIAPEMEQLVLENRSDAALRRSEHKRWQMGVILKVSRKAFGTGRMIPITRK
ncbi:MAG: NAD(+) synthase [Anaerolineales bacterium]|nr:NAD(+) synthase [Anaerolineales bacterium]